MNIDESKRGKDGESRTRLKIRNKILTTKKNANSWKRNMKSTLTILSIRYGYGYLLNWEHYESLFFGSIIEGWLRWKNKFYEFEGYLLMIRRNLMFPLFLVLFYLAIMTDYVFYFSWLLHSPRSLQRICWKKNLSIVI